MKSKFMESANARGKQAQQNTVDDLVHETESEQDLYVQPRATEKSSHKSKTTKSQARKKSAGRGRKAAMPTTPFAAALRSLVAATGAIKEWMGDDESQDVEETREMQEVSSTIASLLRSKASPQEALHSVRNPSDNAELDEIFILRNGSSGFKVLSLVESIPCETPYSTGKTIAFFRMKGALLPHRYAISGYTPCAKNHPLVLDSELWTSRVKRFGIWHDLTFSSDGYDHLHGRDKGDGDASHAEKQAMLAAALWLLKTIMGKDVSMGALWKMKDKLSEPNLPNEIEIGISDRPCNGCKRFQEMLQSYTGLKFIFVFLKNLRVMEKEKDIRGVRRYMPLKGPGVSADVDIEDLEFRNDVMQIKLDRLQNGNEHLRNQVRTLSKNRPRGVAFDDLAAHKKGSEPMVVLRSTTALAKPAFPEKHGASSNGTIVSRKRTYSVEEEFGEGDCLYTPPGRKVRNEIPSPRALKKRALAARGYQVPDVQEELSLDMMEGEFEGLTTMTRHKNMQSISKWRYHP